VHGRSETAPFSKPHGARPAVHVLVRRTLVQASFALVLVLAGFWLLRNAQTNLTARSITSGFDFLTRTAGFAIGETSVRYAPSDSYGRAVLVGLLNTLKVSAFAILGCTLLGLLVGLGRLSGNTLIRGLARAYVELVRNVPLLLQLLFWYAFILNVFPPVGSAWSGPFGIVLSNRGLVLPTLDASGTLDVPHFERFNVEGGYTISAELVTLLIGLSIYTAAYVAEIIRAGILSVPSGQAEATQALGLTRLQALRLVILPQSLRAILPPLASWYLNTVKNSSMAIAVGYPDLLSVIDTIINQTGQAVEGVALMVALYLAVNLAIAALLNVYNTRVALQGPAAHGSARRSHEGLRRTRWSRHSIGNWARRSLTSSWRSTLASAAVLLLAAAALWNTIDWLLLSAVWTDSARCRGPGTGACWPFLRENYRTILFGLYPHEEHWRAALGVALFSVTLGLSFVRALWNGRLVLLWFGVLITMLVLMGGGIFGLDSVPTDKWSGLPLTLILASLAVMLAFPLAILLALGRRSPLPIIQWSCTGFIEFLRATPLVGVLFIAAVMFPLFLPPSVEMNGFLRVQIALVLFTSAYMAEAIRAGLQAVPRGQHEAATALGLSSFQRTTHIVLPQALKVSLPALVNTSISEVKNTTLVLIVGMFDVLQTTRQSLIEPQWRPYFLEAYGFTAALFFILCFAISQLSRKVERHLDHPGK
jgi:general L-amino acid transport system permease protein